MKSDLGVVHFAILGMFEAEVQHERGHAGNDDLTVYMASEAL